MLDLVTITEAARREGVTRQAIRAWLLRHGVRPVVESRGPKRISVSLYDYQAISAGRAGGVASDRPEVNQ